MYRKGRARNTRDKVVIYRKPRAQAETEGRGIWDIVKVVITALRQRKRNNVQRRLKGSENIRTLESIRKNDKCSRLDTVRRIIDDEILALALARLRLWSARRSKSGSHVRGRTKIDAGFVSDRSVLVKFPSSFIFQFVLFGLRKKWL
jgi:hypothetical protein